MPELIISDTSSLIIFHKIGELKILEKVYGNIFITPEVAEEYGNGLPLWITVKLIDDKKYQEFLETQVDKEEASVIALAKENNDSLLLLDDLKARKLAKKLKLKHTGALGVIHKAKQLGVVDKIKPLLEKLLETNFRISKKILDELLKLNDES